MDRLNCNVKQAVPFLFVTNMEASLRFYREGLGFVMTRQWIDKGQLRWCWLELEGAALMLQEFKTVPAGKLGLGVSICFQCEDALALYHGFAARNAPARRPFVGNGRWVTSIADPDGYSLSFESSTDAPEESVLPDSV